MTLRSALLAVTAASAISTVAAQDCSNTLKVDYPAPVAAKGWSYQLVANGFKKPRSITFDNDGGLLLVDAGVGLVHLDLRNESQTCVSVNKKTTLVESTELNHGLALSDDGKTVYASSSKNVYAWTYDSKQVKVSITNRTVVTNMSDTDATTRTLLLSRKKPGVLLVSRGSVEDVDEHALDIKSGHSQIRSFNISSLGEEDNPYDFLDGHIIGWGLRNSVGVAEHPTAGDIWSVENSMDELYRNGQDVHENNPGEELNFHGLLGDPKSTDNVKDQGGNYGYPVCAAIWSTKDFPDLGSLKTGDQFPDSNSTAVKATDQQCNVQFVPPRLVFQAHTAPLDIKFATDGSQAFVSFHGSFDRKNPVGYRISTILFQDGQPSTTQDSTDATYDILTNPQLSNCPGKCFRPVGLARDSTDRLWFSSDSTGEIFALFHDPNAGSGGRGKSSGDDGENGASQLLSGRSTGLGVAVAAIIMSYLLM